VAEVVAKLEDQSKSLQEFLSEVVGSST